MIETTLYRLVLLFSEGVPASGPTLYFATDTSAVRYE